MVAITASSARENLLAPLGYRNGQKIPDFRSTPARDYGIGIG